MKLLEERNSHERDSQLTFNEDLHLYSLNDGRNLTSVTSVIASLFPKFNPDFVIQKMKSNKKSWEKNKYFGLSDEEIKALWDANGREASKEGTILHNDIENFYNELPINNESIEYKYFLNFQKDCNINMYRTEWAVFHEDLDLAGMIDAVAFNGIREDGKIDISLYDWKRSKEIKRFCMFAKQSFLADLDITDTNFNKYSLQLNLYKYIIEQKYKNYVVSKMCLVSLHRNNENYLIFNVPELSEEIDIIINDLKKRKEEKEKN